MARAAIQQHAMRLFLKRGYAAVTADEIADAANVSRSTFFRYFPTKDDVVVRDAFDELFLDAVKAQPADLSPAEAVRRTLHQFMDSLTPEILEMERRRLALILATPELRQRMLGMYPDTLRRITAMLAARSRRGNAQELRLQAGALLGVGLAALVGAQDEDADYFALFEEGLARLDASEGRSRKKRQH
ncbi:MAG: TetR family transcriptional regulator [Myxococcota bacterium]